MATNYYVQVNPEKNTLQNLLDDEEWGELRKELPDRVHIGKSSAGCKFIFNHNNGFYYKRKRKDIAEFIEGNSLWNDYGERVAPKDFWKLVDRKKDGRHSINDLTHDNLMFSSTTSFS